LRSFPGPSWGPFIGAICAPPLPFAGGALLHKFLISRVSGLRTAGSLDEGHFGQLIVTLGISLILQNGGQIVFGSTPVAVRTPLSSEAYLVGPIYGGATGFPNKAKLVPLFLPLPLAPLPEPPPQSPPPGQAPPPPPRARPLGYTRLGQAVRAAADNPPAATYMGIDVDRAYRIAFGLGSGITAIAGGLMATYISFGPFVGFDYVIIMYSGVVLGGMGSILGAFWGGLTVGFVQQFSALILPPQLQNAAIFVVFLMIVLLRPQGLFGRLAEWGLRWASAPRSGRI